ncbi:MAG: hypothetical protein ABH834_01195 [Candidatus Altiarchaeota archaeon]
MNAKKDWKCTLCGNHVEEEGKVCVACRTDTTAVRGLVDKKKIEKKTGEDSCD